jgi:hypothetical protein
MALIANRDLLKKLLSLFPSKFLKEHFNQTGSHADAIEEVSSLPIASILAFIKIYHPTTKQNIHLFKLNRSFNPAQDLNGFPLIINDRATSAGKNFYYLFPETVYSVYLSNDVERQELNFLQPVVLEIEGRNLTVKFTKMQKDIKNYFATDRNPKLAGETNSELDTLNNIKAHFLSVIGLEVNDFNAGIKSLWADDVLDCHKIRYRDAYSTTLITMNEELTFKQQFPDKYEEMQHAPIGASVWKFMGEGEDGSILDTFACDPTEGTINISKYSDNTNQTKNVISRILDQN